MRPIIYAGVFGVLAVSTAVEVQIALAPLSRSIIAAAVLASAALKGALIALYYMHLRYERWSVGLLAFPPLILALSLLTAMIL